MNRAFKTQFHNGELDGKVIVTMSVTVNNNKRFHSLDRKGRKNLVKSLEQFKKSLEIFTEEIKNNHYNKIG
jgi:hypothetical protein